VKVVGNEGAAVEPTHRVGDDVDRTFGVTLLDCVREHAGALFVGAKRGNPAKQSRVTTKFCDMGLQSAEIVDPNGGSL
jgi:hypothetical protein